jgi:hypothetical protein
MRFVKNYRQRHVTYHLEEGRSPRCYSRVEEPATEDEFCDRVERDGQLYLQAWDWDAVDVRAGRPFIKHTCRQCFWRYVQLIGLTSRR